MIEKNTVALERNAAAFERNAIAYEAVAERLTKTEIRIEKIDTILCGDNGVLQQVKKNTITLYGDDIKEGLVDRSKSNRSWLTSLSALFGVLTGIIFVEHVGLFEQWVKGFLKIP